MSAAVLPSSRARLSREALPRFPDDKLFHHVARVVYEAECLPRKELLESWEVHAAGEAAFSRREGGGPGVGARVRRDHAEKPSAFR